MIVPVHAAHAAAMQALKSSGVVVRVEAKTFAAIVNRAEGLLVVVSHGGMFRKRYRYLTSYKGLAFHATSSEPLTLGRSEVIVAQRMAIPDV